MSVQIPDDWSVSDTARAQAGLVECLTRTQRDLDKAKWMREHYIRLGRRYGMTNRAIAEPLGITEAGVRRILERAETPHPGDRPGGA